MKDKHSQLVIPEAGVPVKPAPPAVRLIHAPAAAPQGRIVLDDLAIRIDQDGLWYYHGSLIRRKELICLFASALTRDSDGGYWLVTPAEMGRIEVEDAPFVAIEMYRAGCGHSAIISFRTNVDEMVTLDPDHPLNVGADAGTGDPRPYLSLDRGLFAKLNRPVYYELVELGSEHEMAGQSHYGVWSCGHFFPLGILEDVQ